MSARPSAFRHPASLLLRILLPLLRLLFRPALRGGEHLAGPGGRILICNSLSWLDIPLLRAALPGRPVFLLDPAIPFPAALRGLLPALDTVALDGDQAHRFAAATSLLAAGRTLVAFPEGRPTVTGALMLLRPAALLLAEAAGLPLTPLHLDGPQHGPFAPLDRSMVRKRLFPRAVITVGAPVPTSRASGPDEGHPPQDARHRLREIMTESAFQAADTGLCLHDAVLGAAREWGGGREAVADPIRGSLSFRGVLAGSRAFAERFAALGPAETRVALLLPSAGGTLCCLLGLCSAGLVPVMLNPRGGVASWEAARRATRFRTLLTVRPVVQRLKLEAELDLLRGQGVTVSFLDDAPLRLREKLRGLWRGHQALRPRQPDDPAVILLTSGASGIPKAVVLSHRNIIANVRQVAAVLDFGPRDRLLNALPLFHCFGLSSGTLLPLVCGARVFLHPNPLDYDGVPEWCYRTGATVLFVTQSFAEGYLRRADPLALASLRLVIGGASKLRRDTIHAWSERFGQRLLVGYGLTETAPVISLNVPASNRQDSAGVPLPGIELRFTAVDGIDNGGGLAVRGPNVMLGYLDPDGSGALLPLEQRWIDTGDIARLEPDGHLVIVDRLSRFAKVGGEKVSLDQLDQIAATLWPDRASLAVALPDPRKGERIVLLTERPGATRQELLPAARAAGLPEIALPSQVITVPAVPLLGSGKADLQMAKRMALDLAAAPG